ncbi:MAG: hypothetical protein AAF824_02775 [Bacteroidota bacterium]
MLPYLSSKEYAESTLSSVRKMTHWRLVYAVKHVSMFAFLIYFLGIIVIEGVFFYLKHENIFLTSHTTQYINPVQTALMALDHPLVYSLFFGGFIVYFLSVYGWSYLEMLHSRYFYRKRLELQGVYADLTPSKEVKVLETHLMETEKAYFSLPQRISRSSDEEQAEDKLLSHMMSLKEHLHLHQFRNKEEFIDHRITKELASHSHNHLKKFNHSWWKNLKRFLSGSFMMMGSYKIDIKSYRKRLVFMILVIAALQGAHLATFTRYKRIAHFDSSQEKTEHITSNSDKRTILDSKL